MDIIKNVLMDKKFFEAEEDVERFLEEHDLAGSMVVQSLIFDKKIFITAAAVREWVANHHNFTVHKIDETDASFRVRQLDPSAFIEGSFRTITLPGVKGIKAVVGRLRSEQLEDPFAFSLRNFDGIELSDSLPHIIELVKVVNGYHQRYGKIDITKDFLRSYVQNFNDNVVGVDISIDFDHEKREAGGWLKSVFLSFDEDIMFGEVKWTPKGALALSDREFRYFSPEIHPNYIHPLTGKEHGPTLLGGALVNRPFLKMGPIVEMNDKGNNNLEDIVDLKEHNTIVEGLTEKITALKLSEEKAKTTINGMKTLKEVAEAKVKELTEVAEKKDDEIKINELFTKEKISKAQKEAFESGKVEFCESTYQILLLSEGLRITAKGKGGGNDEGEGTFDLSAEDKEACKTLGLSEKDYAEANGLVTK